jgi:hypothetical protein
MRVIAAEPPGPSHGNPDLGGPKVPRPFALDRILRGMRGVQSGLVDIIRDFLRVHQRMRALLASYRDHSIRFEELRDLVGDSEDSPLFRLKERCHQLFRADEADDRIRVHREVLFDLAVGSLFHEAMKLRENLYQREVYGPKVDRLRRKASDEGDPFFIEFGKILRATDVRLEEAVDESEALLNLTRQQFCLLLADHSAEGLVARTLFEHRVLVDSEFDGGLDELLEAVYASPGEGLKAAALSYLRSAHFSEALEVVDQAKKRAVPREEWERMGAYAEGMQAFSAGRYRDCVERLRDWIDRFPVDLPEEHPERSFARLAATAWSRVGPLLADVDSSGVGKSAAGELAERLAVCAGTAGEVS